MRTRLVLTLGLLLALAVPATASAQQQSAPLLITGGGQVLASSDPSSEMGPGDTIAFVARERRNATGPINADGSTQVVKTSESDDSGQPSIIFNGQVTCILDEDADDNEARFGGVERNADGDARAFVVDVVDTGDESRGTDQIEFRFTDNDGNPCDDDAMGTLLNGTTLARGNLKIDTANSGR